MGDLDIYQYTTMSVDEELAWVDKLELTEEMTAAERAWLNAYHARVYAELAPRLSEEERAFLAECTRAL